MDVFRESTRKSLARLIRDDNPVGGRGGRCEPRNPMTASDLENERARS
jgi:hypothetical protein